MSREVDFEIKYTILRDEKEIGFGAAIWSDIPGALYAIQSDIQNLNWETTLGMPDPEDFR